MKISSSYPRNFCSSIEHIKFQCCFFLLERLRHLKPSTLFDDPAMDSRTHISECF